MPSSQPRSGFTLPVFACAAAIAALRHLRDATPVEAVSLNLVEPPEIVSIPIEQVALVKPGMALAIVRSDPGDNLDLTRHTPVWAVVEWGSGDSAEPIQLIGGEGIGKRADGQAAIYAYAQRLLRQNLESLRQSGETLRVTIVLPQGRSLAERTSNAAFGVVEGLSLLGTTGISAPLSAPGQLEQFRTELQQKASQFDCLVFCVGENGLDLMRQQGVAPDRLIKTANWLGPLLVEAGMQGVKSLLLFGYHGKLLKLAGGIFHTHHQVADARQEILTACCVRAGLPIADCQHILTSATAEDGLAYLRQREAATGQPWASTIYLAIAETIDQRAARYIQTHAERTVRVGTVLFDRNRQILARSNLGNTLLGQVLLG